MSATDTKSWKSTRAWLGGAETEIGKQSVYVIRIAKPFAIAYEKKASPVMYIGEGNFGERLRNHIKNWIFPIVSEFPNATVEIYFTKVKVRGNSEAYRDVEADLLHRFSQSYGCVPLMNKQFEYHSRKHTYEKGFFKPIQKERGSGYKWGLRPLISNMAYPASLKGVSA